MMIPEVSVQELKLMRHVYLLDVRTEEEWRIARIRGAVLIPLDRLPMQVPHIKEVLGERIVVVYCHTGRRSRIATDLLRQHGIEAYNLSGGIDAWSAIDPSVPRY